MFPKNLGKSCLEAKVLVLLMVFEEQSQENRSDAGKKNNQYKIALLSWSLLGAKHNCSHRVIFNKSGLGGKGSEDLTNDPYVTFPEGVHTPNLSGFALLGIDSVS